MFEPTNVYPRFLRVFSIVLQTLRVLCTISISKVQSSRAEKMSKKVESRDQALYQELYTRVSCVPVCFK